MELVASWFRGWEAVISDIHSSFVGTRIRTFEPLTEAVNPRGHHESHARSECEFLTAHTHHSTPQNTHHSIPHSATQVREWATPVLKDSKFLERLGLWVRSPRPSSPSRCPTSALIRHKNQPASSPIPAFLPPVPPPAQLKPSHTTSHVHRRTHARTRTRTHTSTR